MRVTQLEIVISYFKYVIRFSFIPGKYNNLIIVVMGNDPILNLYLTLIYYK